MELLLALPVGHPVPALTHPLTAAHMAYRVGPGPNLLGIRLPDDLRGGLMYLDCAGFAGDGDPLPCCSQILGECRRREYRGILCDFDAPPDSCLSRLLTVLDEQCAREGWQLCVTEPWAGCAPTARVLIPSPITSGTLERRLREAGERHGAGRIALAVEWQRTDLTLPAEGGSRALTPLELEDQRRRLEPAVFFDRGLCAHYYTYRDRRGCSHFVVFDTARSIRAKLSLAQRLGLPAAVLAAPELEGRWVEIFG